VYLREARLELSENSLRLDGVQFRSRQLHEHLAKANATRALLVAVSAGPECEAHARRLWEEAKPDECSSRNLWFGGRRASGGHHQRASLRPGAGDGLIAVPHYSPGYSGWDVVDQRKLLDLIRAGATKPFPDRWK
jgi:hypothetical protein